MSHSSDDALSDWVHRKLAALRTQLEQTGRLPETAEELLRQLLPSNQLPPVATEEDFEMLSLIISDTLQGVDIPTRYPSFYNKLLTNSELREAFLDALTILEQPELLEPLPATPDRDLTFLKTASARPLIGQPAPGQWRVTWRQTIAQLQALFSPPEWAYRSEENFLEDDYITLLRSEVLVEQNHFDVLLSAVRSAENPDFLNLQLTIALSTSQATTGDFSSLVARVQWGNYNETGVIDKNGQAAFPRLPFSMILSGPEPIFTSDLEFSLEIPIP